MKVSFAFLFASVTSAGAFAPPATTDCGSSSTLQAASLSASEIEGLLSGPKLEWYQGKAQSNAATKKGDAVFELEETKKKIKSLQAEIAAGKFSVIDDECSVDDSRIECMLSPIERLWYRGRGIIQNEAQANQELKRLTQKAADLNREIQDGLSTGSWGKLNTAA